MSLEQVDALLYDFDDYDGGAGFADTFAALDDASTQRSVATKHTAAINAALADQVGRGKAATNDGRVVVRTPPRPTTKRRVTSARAKAADPVLWKSACVRTNRVQVFNPVKKVLTPADLDLPPVSKVTDALLIAKAAAASIKHKTEAVTAVHKARLLELAEMMGWDGHPVKWTCGWSGHLWVPTYSEDRLYEIAPDVWEELAVDETSEGRAGVKVLALDTSDGE
jgi:hypothetical protein